MMLLIGSIDSLFQKKKTQNIIKCVESMISWCDGNDIETFWRMQGWGTTARRRRSAATTATASRRSGCATAMPTATAARTSATARNWPRTRASRRSTAAATAPACPLNGSATAIATAPTCPTKSVPNPSTIPFLFYSCFSCYYIFE